MDEEQAGAIFHRGRLSEPRGFEARMMHRSTDPGGQLLDLNIAFPFLRQADSYDLGKIILVIHLPTTATTCDTAGWAPLQLRTEFRTQHNHNHKRQREYVWPPERPKTSNYIAWRCKKGTIVQRKQSRGIVPWHPCILLPAL